MTNYPSKTWDWTMISLPCAPRPKQSFPPPSFRRRVSSPSALHASQHKPYWHGSSSPSGCVFCFESTLARLLCLFHSGSTSWHPVSAHSNCLHLNAFSTPCHHCITCFRGIFQIAVGELLHDFSTCLYVVSKQSVARYCFRFANI